VAASRPFAGILHQDLTVAAEARDGELARQIMQLHLRMSYHRFMKHRDQFRRTG